MNVPFVQSAIESAPGSLRYAVLLLLAFAENVLLWLPGDIVGVSTALLAAGNKLPALPAMLAVAVGGWGGFVFYYEVGRRLVRLVRRTPLTRSVKSKHLGRAVTRLRRHGCWLVAAYRFFPGCRTAMALGAGMLAIPRPAVWCLSLVSALVWNGLLLVFAATLVEWFGAVGPWMPFAVLAGLATLALAVLTWQPRPGRGGQSQRPESGVERRNVSAAEPDRQGLRSGPSCMKVPFFAAERDVPQWRSGGPVVAVIPAGDRRFPMRKEDT